MSIMRLPAKWHIAREQPAPDARPFWSPENGATERPEDELIDLYGVILVAVPLALFLRWLWP
ncbi:MAG TPA: hypothetical protein VFB13_09165 [Reyranella sp.]|jgi:hypothetical protein|nr:hypothetical protein [Reyranella sp.]